MTERELIRQFESCTLPPAGFHHADHVRLAFAYLLESSPLEALERFTSALKRYAASLGKAHLYHETITHAYFFLIRERMVRNPADSWEHFAEANPDLLQWKGGLLNRYYSDATLQSELARSIFLLPDKRD
jgi:hypothetical protein